MHYSSIMMSIQFVILLLVGEIYKLEAKNFHPGLYQADKHHITILNNDNYRQLLFDPKSDVMYFVEFYAHWCGTCKRYAPAWIKLANEAKSWQKVVKFAAMNCGDSLNSAVCAQFEIDMYPTVRLFPVRPRFNPPLHGGRDFDTDKKSSFLSDLLTEIQNLNKPSWPNLKPFKSQDLSEIFAPKQIQKQNFAFLILEDDALIAKKIIMDFSEFSDDFVVRRTSWSENWELMKSLKIDNSSLPGLLVIENINSRIFYRLLNKNLNLQNKNTRDILGSLIKEYMQTAPYVNHKIATTTKALIATTKNTEQVTNNVTKMSMQDLETGLHLMIRNEIPHSSIIRGEELYALRRWIRTLALYFPGRKEVRNYLTNLDRKLSSVNSDEITGDQWIQMTKEDQNNESYLPESTEWAHCKGSTPNYRGFPCSLWTLFHTLTVRQYELEIAKSKPFEHRFDVREVIDSVRFFVKHFFRCSECSKNFKKETYDYLDHLNKPQDAVLYLWKVHNSVNKRLANDITEDPAYPKDQFPSKNLCSDCYDSNNQLIEQRVFDFLLSFYSTKNMLPATNQHLPEDKINNRNLHKLRLEGQKDKSILEKFQPSTGLYIGIFLITVTGLMLLFIGIRKSRTRFGSL